VVNETIDQLEASGELAIMLSKWGLK
jgi:ABC-type amino acid transport substrate-binding protein